MITTRRDDRRCSSWPLLGGRGHASAWRSSTGGGTEVDALFESTVGLYPGSDVQVLGVKVGTVTDGRARRRPVVRVSMKLDRASTSRPTRLP